MGRRESECFHLESSLSQNDKPFANEMYCIKKHNLLSAGSKCVLNHLREACQWLPTVAAVGFGCEVVCSIMRILLWVDCCAEFEGLISHLELFIV